MQGTTEILHFLGFAPGVHFVLLQNKLSFCYKYEHTGALCPYVGLDLVLGILFAFCLFILFYDNLLLNTCCEFT